MRARRVVLVHDEPIRPIDVPQEVIDVLCKDFGITPDQAADLVVLMHDELRGAKC